jgi:plastocyanin
MSSSADATIAKRTRLLASSIALFLIASDTLDAGVVTGVVRTVGRSGVTPAPAVVYAESIDAVSPRTSRREVVRQKNKTFQPRVLTVPVGGTVEFPNDDNIFHNVFSLSPPQPFDLGLYRAGDTRSLMFSNPGIYRVFCNIHPQMNAFIVVAPSAFAAVASPDGRFTLDLPRGRYRLTALSERAAPVSVEITSTDGATTAPELTLNESNWVFTQHKNKFGQDYSAAAYRR